MGSDLTIKSSRCPTRSFGGSSPSQKEETMNGVILDEHDRRYALQELENCRDEMLQKLYEAGEIIKNLCEKDRMIWTRAESYWFNSISNNLHEESGSFLGSMTNFSDTLKELKEHVEEVNAGAFDDIEKK
jgi:hypothetical protein